MSFQGFALKTKQTFFFLTEDQNLFSLSFLSEIGKIYSKISCCNLPQANLISSIVEISEKTENTFSKKSDKKFLFSCEESSTKLEFPLSFN